MKIFSRATEPIKNEYHTSLSSSIQITIKGFNSVRICYILNRCFDV